MGNTSNSCFQEIIRFSRTFLEALVHDSVDMVHRGEIRQRFATTLSADIARLTDSDILSLPALGRSFTQWLATRKDELCLPDTLESPMQASLVAVMLQINGIDEIDNLSCLGRTMLVNEIKILRQVLGFGAKWRMNSDSSKLQAKIKTFVEIEACLPEPSAGGEHLSESTRRTVEVARVLLARVLESTLKGPEGSRVGLDPLAILPSHGPGAVAEKVRNHDKWYTFPYHRSLDDVFSYADYTFVNATHLVDSSFIAESGFQTTDVPKVSRLVAVPKDFRGPRLIACEPVACMYFQQGLKDLLYDWLEKHPLTRGRVSFTDQGINRSLAELGSYTSHLETLDLSDASDRVSMWLVNMLLPPRWTRVLNAVRSTHVDLGDDIPADLPHEPLLLKKHATMGSAVCFPIEAMVFWALAVSFFDPDWALGRRGHRTRQQPSVYVYGDDLIVPAGRFHDLNEFFSELSLVFNTHKCCIAKHFRESCGLDAFLGEDVSCTQPKALPFEVTPGDLVAHCAIANALRGKGYHFASECFFNIVEDVLGPLPCAPPGELSLARHVESWTVAALHNFARGVPIGIDSDLHNFVMRVWVTSPVHYDAPKGRSGWGDLHRLLTEKAKREVHTEPHTFRLMPDEEPSPRVDQWTLPHALRLRKQWVPLHNI